MSSFLPDQTVDKLAPILRNREIDCRAIRTSRLLLQFTFSAKANRILGEFESAPLIRELQKHLGGAFTRIRKSKPIKAESPTAVVPNTATSAPPLVASSSAVAAGIPQITPTNSRVNGDGQPHVGEKEELVKKILANEHKSYYAILGVTEKATLAELKSSYRTVARQVHPDKNRAPNASRAFQLVGQAYSVLSDPDQRAAYDTSRRGPDRKPAAKTKAEETPFEFDADELYRSFFPEEDVDTVHVEISEPDWENQKDSLEKMFDTQLAQQCADLPTYQMPPQLAHLKLFDYQVVGIRWMIHSERRNEIPSWFEQEGPRTWRDKITGTTFQRKPPPVKGGILADGASLFGCLYVCYC